MHIAVFYQYYHNPDCAAAAKHYTSLQHWVAEHTVTMITSARWRGERLTERYPWVPEGVRLVEFDVPYDNRMSALRRGGAFARYALKALRAGSRMPRPDVVFGTSTPLSAAWVAARVARHHGVPWVFEVRDLWPDFPIEMGAVPPRLHGPLRAAEARLYRDAAHLVAFSPGIEAHLAVQGHADKTTLLYNGTDLALIDAARGHDFEALRSAYGLGDKRVLLYAGTFGRANAISLMLEAARRLAYRDDHVFVFLGDGYYQEALAEAERTLPNVRLVPPQPHHAIFDWFHLAYASLVSFLPLPVLGANSPSKLYDSLACGTPIVVTNDGWMRDLVEAHGCGWFASSADEDGYVATLAHLLDHPEEVAEAGERAAAMVHHPGLRILFDRDAQARRYLDIFERVAGG